MWRGGDVWVLIWGEDTKYVCVPPLQALLWRAHEVEVRKKRAEDRVENQLRIPEGTELPTAVRHPLEPPLDPHPATPSPSRCIRGAVAP